MLHVHMCVLYLCMCACVNMNMRMYTRVCTRVWVFFVGVRAHVHIAWTSLYKFTHPYSHRGEGAEWGNVARVW